MHVLLQTNLAEQVHSSPSATAKCSDHHGLQALPAASEHALHVIHHRLLIFVRLKLAKRLACLFCRECERTSRGSRKACVVSECSNTASLIVRKEFQIVQGSAALVEPGKNLRPASLLLVAVRELDVGMPDGLIGLGEFLETDDGHTLGFRCLMPCIVLNELAINAVDEFHKHYTSPHET